MGDSNWESIKWGNHGTDKKLRVVNGMVQCLWVYHIFRVKYWTKGSFRNHFLLLTQHNCVPISHDYQGRLGGKPLKEAITRYLFQLKIFKLATAMAKQQSEAEFFSSWHLAFYVKYE